MSEKSTIHRTVLGLENPTLGGGGDWSQVWERISGVKSAIVGHKK